MYVNNFISIMKGIIYCNQKKKQMKNPFTPINRYIKCCLQAYFALTKSPVYTTTFSLYATIFFTFGCVNNESESSFATKKHQALFFLALNKD